MQFAQRVVPSEQLWEEAMTMARAIVGMSPQGVRMTMAHLSRVEDLSKEGALSFANQVGEWFSTGGSFAFAPQDVLQKKAAD